MPAGHDTTAPNAYSLTPHERVEVTGRGAEALVALVTYGAGGSPPPSSLPSFQDEEFAVLAGTLTVEIDGRRRTVAAGETFDVPRRAVHRMWNEDAAAPADVRWTTSPPGRTEQWWQGLHAAGEVSPSGGLVRRLALLREFGDVFQLAVPGALRPLARRLVRERAPVA